MVTAEKNGILSTTETFEIQVQETSSLFEYGPYKVSWINLFNVTGNPMRISIYYPSIEDGKDSQPNVAQGPYATLLVSPGIFRIIGLFLVPIHFRPAKQKIILFHRQNVSKRP